MTKINGGTHRRNLRRSLVALCLLWTLMSALLLSLSLACCKALVAALPAGPSLSQAQAALGWCRHELIASHLLVWLASLAVVMVTGRSLMRREGERFSALRDLASSSARLQNVFDSIHEGYLLQEIVRGEEGAPTAVRLVDVNHVVAALAGRDRLALVGELMGPELCGGDFWLEKMERVVSNRAAECFDYPCAALGKYFRVVAFPAEGNRVAAMLTDITDLKKSEAELTAAKNEAEMASAVRSQFLATMSHEIRTPLNGVIGMSELLAETEMSTEQDEYLRIVRESASTLLALVNDILDLSRIESGKLQLEEGVFPLPEMVDSVMSTFTVLASSKGVRLTSLVASAVPLSVLGDQWRLRQVLTNLVANAVKFTEQGEVRLTVAPEEGSGELLFTVSDTGIGIPPAHLDDIFDTFTQADGSTTRRFGGSGLGLAIARRIVERMGGCMGVSSQQGVGSEFWFRVPLPAAAVELPAVDLSVPQAAQRQIGYSVLVVEDNRINQVLATKILEKAGHGVTLANNGKEAIDLLQAGGIDLVLMDVSMPVMDGMEACKAIRDGAAGEAARLLPIAAMTAHALPGDAQKFKVAGMNGYIAKPIMAQKLLRLVEALGAGELR